MRLCGKKLVTVARAAAQKSVVCVMTVVINNVLGVLAAAEWIMKTARTVPVRGKSAVSVLADLV